MASIRSKNTKLELSLKKELKRQGLKFVMHAKLPGTPDFVFPGKRLVVFCHGDFWHGKNYDIMRPKLNSYWRNKIEKNMERDKRVEGKLSKMNWRVMTLKGSEIRKDIQRATERIKRKLSKEYFNEASERAWKWLCLRYHGKVSCAEIARRYGVSRQAVNYATIKLAHRLSHVGRKRDICPTCRGTLLSRETEIKTNKYDNWKKYSQSEINYIRENMQTKTPEQIAKHLGRTPKGVTAKIRRMKMRK